MNDNMVPYTLASLWGKHLSLGAIGYVLSRRSYSHQYECQFLWPFDRYLFYVAYAVVSVVDIGYTIGDFDNLLLYLLGCSAISQPCKERGAIPTPLCMIKAATMIAPAGSSNCAISPSHIESAETIKTTNELRISPLWLRASACSALLLVSFAFLSV